MAGALAGDGAPAVDEVLLFFPHPAATVIDQAAAFLLERGVALTHRSPYSVAFEHGQVASVPVQLRPEWCRVWVTITRDSPGAAAAWAFIDTHRDASRTTSVAVTALEKDLYADGRWPVLEAQLRSSLSQQGTSGADVEARIAAFKQRWLALARRAAAAPPEEPDPA